MGNVQYLSAERLEQLKQELKELKSAGRREAANRIETAKALGDLSENAEYHEAKDAMALLEGRIYEIEDILKDAKIIEEPGKEPRGSVGIGTTVEVMVKDKPKTFTIVGSNEADPGAGRVSNESPIGSALLGARVGDNVEVKTPSGVMVYTIKAIQ